MTENQRTQLARPELSLRNTGAEVRSQRSVVIYMIIAVAILIALGYATIQALDGWAMWVVLAGIVMTAVGGMIAVSPNRKA